MFQRGHWKLTGRYNLRDVNRSSIIKLSLRKVSHKHEFVLGFWLRVIVHQHFVRTRLQWLFFHNARVRSVHFRLRRASMRDKPTTIAEFSYGTRSILVISCRKLVPLILIVLQLTVPLSITQTVWLDDWASQHRRGDDSVPICRSYTFCAPRCWSFNKLNDIFC